MAGARTQGVGRGVRWDAFANIASLLAGAGRARGEGYANLGAGIGAGISAFGANKRQEKRDAQAAQERDAERAYRAQRDGVEDARWQASFDQSKMEFDARMSDRAAAKRAQANNAIGDNLMAALKFQNEVKEAESLDLKRRADILGGLSDDLGAKMKAAIDTYGSQSPQAKQAVADYDASIQSRQSLVGQLSLRPQSTSPLSLDGVLTPGGPLSAPAAPQGGINEAPAVMRTEPRATIGLPGGFSLPLPGDVAEAGRQVGAQAKQIRQIQALTELAQQKARFGEVSKRLDGLREEAVKTEQAALKAVQEADGKPFDQKQRLGFGYKRAAAIRRGVETATERMKHQVVAAEAVVADRIKREEDDRTKAETQARERATIEPLDDFKGLSPERQAAILNNPSPKYAFEQERKVADRERKADAKLAEQGFNPEKRDLARGLFVGIMDNRVKGIEARPLWVSDVDAETLGALITGYGLNADVDISAGSVIRDEILRLKRPGMATPEQAAKSIIEALPPKARTGENITQIARLFGIGQKAE